jgi:hypothetical protein
MRSIRAVGLSGAATFAPAALPIATSAALGGTVTDELTAGEHQAVDPVRQFRGAFAETMPTIIGFLAGTPRTRDVTPGEFEVAVRRLHDASNYLLRH